MMLVSQEIIEELESESNFSKPTYKYCPQCRNKAWLNPHHANHLDERSSDAIDIQGVAVIENIVSPEEEKDLIQLIDSNNPWVPSQEGRSKQDFGPKVNFLARRVSIGNFRGFPEFARNILMRTQNDNPDLLVDFKPVEFCILEYTPERGSYIRPHFDDKWVWGDRLITVNLLSDTVLRLTREFNIPPYEIIIKMPARSLIVIYGEARYNWLHSIKKNDITSRRIAMTWREFSDDIIADNDYAQFVDEVFTIANNKVFSA